MLIKPAQVEDLQQILTIDKDSITPAWSCESFLSEINSNDSFFEIAIDDNDDNKIAGFYILRHMGDEAELLRIAVDKSNRKSGVATKLLTSMFKYAQANKIRSIFLEVRKSNTSAISLYKKFDFIQIGTRVDYYSDPTEDAVIMKYR